MRHCRETLHNLGNSQGPHHPQPTTSQIGLAAHWLRFFFRASFEFEYPPKGNPAKSLASITYHKRIMTACSCKF